MFLIRTAPVVAALMVFALVMAPVLPGQALADEQEVVTPGPDQLIRDTVAAFRKELRTARGRSLDKRRRMAKKLVAEHVTPNTDFELMARKIFADHWEQIEAEGMTEAAVAKVQGIVHRIHVGALAHYSNQRIRVFTAEVEGGNARVHLKVDAFKTFTVDLYLSLREDGHWKIYDFAVLGASFVETLTRGYNKVIAEKGLQQAMGDDSVRMEGEV